MNIEAEMKLIGELRGRKFYWADKQFIKPGLYIWTGKRNLRIIPWIKL